MGNKNTRELDDEEIEEIQQNTQLSRQQILDMYEEFKRDYPDGVISREEFYKMYKGLFPEGDATRYAQHVFRAYDVDGNGVIDFNEFMSAISKTSKGTLEEKLKWVFNLFDIDGSGEVSKPEATEMIMAFYRLQGVPEAKEKAIIGTDTLFQYLDKDESGALNEAEFTDGIKACTSVLDVLCGPI